MGKFYVYFDSGTTNSRGYLLTDSLALISMEKAAVGSKDSAIAGTNKVLIDALFGIYKKLLSSAGLDDGDIIDVYASGMVTCPNGLKEVPHLTLPLSAADFAEKAYPFFEETAFGRVIRLIPGMKTVSDDFNYLNNVRGEEIEIIGMTDTLTKLIGSDEAAVVLPGSHTHTIHVASGEIKGILSTFTGEVFHALKSATIMAPELDIAAERLDLDKLREGIKNLNAFGFNRALYIGHAMRMFEKGTELERLSYCEGVIFGGYAEALKKYCSERWTNCRTAVIAAAPGTVMDVYHTVIEEAGCMDRIIELPLSAGTSYALEGFKKIVRLGK